MSEPTTVDPDATASASDAAERERERVVAKIERGLADVKAGRLVPHTEVLARIDARYPGSK